MADYIVAAIIDLFIIATNAANCLASSSVDLWARESKLNASRFF